MKIIKKPLNLEDIKWMGIYSKVRFLNLSHLAKSYNRRAESYFKSKSYEVWFNCLDEIDKNQPYIKINKDLYSSNYMIIQGFIGWCCRSWAWRSTVDLAHLYFIDSNSNDYPKSNLELHALSKKRNRDFVESIDINDFFKHLKNND
jgi:hypothetical protein